MNELRVLYLGGFGRSGSTLLDRILGQVPGVFSAGELTYVWEMGLGENRLCGCGELFRACPYWGEVGDLAFGGWDRVDPRTVVELRRSVDRNRYIPFMLRRGLWRNYDEHLERYASMMKRLLLGAREASGASVIVDSSKFPSSGFVLRTIPEIDLRVVHLVRDPRGVAHSWAKRTRRSDVVGSTVFMRRFGPVQAGWRWTTRNLAAEWLARRSRPSLRLRYEDLIADPRGSVVDVLRLASGSSDAHTLGFLGQDEAQLGPTHSIHGNPMHRSTGRVPLRLDEGWRTGSSTTRRALVSALTWPLRRRYGYP